MILWSISEMKAVIFMESPWKSPEVQITAHNRGKDEAELCIMPQARPGN